MGMRQHFFTCGRGNRNYPRRVGSHGYSSLLVCLSVCLLLPEARVGGHGYSSRFCSFVVTGESTHLGAMALHG